MDESEDLIAQLVEMHRKGILTDEELSSKIASIRNKTTTVHQVITSKKIKHPASVNMLKSYALFIVLMIICIPSVMYFKENLKNSLFNTSGTDDDGFSELCLLAGDPKNPTSLGHRVSFLVNSMQDHGAKTSWEKEDKGIIFRARSTENGEDRDMRLELSRTANATPLSDCKDAKEGALATRLTAGPEEATGRTLLFLMQQMIESLTLIDAAEKQNSFESAGSQSDESQQKVNKTVSMCYHSDICGLVKIIEFNVVKSNGSEKLVKSLDQFSEPQAVENEKDLKNIVWNDSKIVYAVCSTSRPTLIFQTEGNKWVGEELDVATGLGVQADHINLYMNLCHPNNPDIDPNSYGYKPLDDDSDNDISVTSPESYFGY